MATIQHVSQKCDAAVKSTGSKRQQTPNILSQRTSTAHHRHFTPRPKHMWICPLRQTLQGTVRQNKQTQVFLPTGHHTHEQLTRLCECLPAVSAQYPVITNDVVVYIHRVLYICRVFIQCAVHNIPLKFNIIPSSLTTQPVQSVLLYIKPPLYLIYSTTRNSFTIYSSVLCITHSFLFF